MTCLLCHQPLPPDHAGVHAACRDLQRQGQALVRRALKRLGLPDPDVEALKDEAVQAAAARMATMATEVFALRAAKRDAEGLVATLRAEVVRLERSVAEWQRVADKATAGACKVAAEREADKLAALAREAELRKRLLTADSDVYTAGLALERLTEENRYLTAAIVEERGRVAGLRDALAEARRLSRIDPNDTDATLADVRVMHVQPAHGTNCGTCDRLRANGSSSACSFHGGDAAAHTEAGK